MKGIGKNSTSKSSAQKIGAADIFQTQKYADTANLDSAKH
eukprot:CAMPEP_0170540290 /NCGR_PEP_ID=MMETSP0211-20121228/311_1 /TAXON_ID=311385 /ORGANISM="Pseudokeronopsis sp., Strain OXSARD2" /LENGTH=39 /DNA_ID= /DNA_START= /DNA_END= /DNA_ORIENTATION=